MSNICIFYKFLHFPSITSLDLCLVRKHTGALWSATTLQQVVHLVPQTFRDNAPSLFVFSISIETTRTWYFVNSRRNVDSEKSEPQMGFKPTTLREIVGCSNHWATRDSVVSKGQVVGMTGTASRGYTAMYLAHMNSLTASRCRIDALMWQRDAVSEFIWAKYMVV